VRKNCSSEREKLLKFEADSRFAKFLRTLEQFVQTVKGQNIFLVTKMLFQLVHGGFPNLKIRTIRIQMKKNIGI
jgi:hypothetical protein